MAIGSGDTPPRCTHKLCLTPAAKLYQERTFVKNQIGTGPSITRSSQLELQIAGQKKLDCEGLVFSSMENMSIDKEVIVFIAHRCWQRSQQ
jgi:hypothetical protein